MPENNTADGSGSTAAQAEERTCETQSSPRRSLLTTLTNSVLTRLVILTTVLLFALAACGGGSDEGKVVDANEFGQAWPLSVESGVVTCESGNIALFTTEGTTYGLNPPALDANYPDVEPLRIANPAIPELKMDLGTLVNLALRQC